MTTQSNEKVVAELYWTLRAIKEATGITTKCWRPPYGDVDDRVRAIAHQMGLQTILWDEDTTVDGYFQGWIDNFKNGKDKQHGHIVLEHELNNATVNMTEHWLPKLQETFNVVTIQQCMNISNPYWEENWQYPTEANPLVNNTTIANTTTTNTTSSVTASSSSVVAAAITSTAPTSAVSSTDAAQTTNVNLAANSESTQSGASSLKASSFLVAIVAAAYFF
ncbi:hypothetical protein G6F42_015212 [Rhizopus arrhizus]|nr:hypothetical protein G6F42_015212 [Rhizopus arrhizus]